MRESDLRALYDLNAEIVDPFVHIRGLNNLLVRCVGSWPRTACAALLTHVLCVQSHVQAMRMFFGKVRVEMAAQPQFMYQNTRIVVLAPLLVHYKFLLLPTEMTVKQYTTLNIERTSDDPLVPGWRITRHEDHISVASFVEGMPFIGWLYTSVFRPFMGLFLALVFRVMLLFFGILTLPPDPARSVGDQHGARGDSFVTMLSQHAQPAAALARNKVRAAAGAQRGQQAPQSKQQQQQRKHRPEEQEDEASERGASGAEQRNSDAGWEQVGRKGKARRRAGSQQGQGRAATAH